MNPGGTTLFDHRIDRRVVIKLLGASAAVAGLTGGAPALAGEVTSSERPGRQREDLLLTASRLFDGRRMLTDTAVFIRDGKIGAVGRAGSIRTGGARRIDLGNATILPGFIDLHVHVGAQHIPFERVLTHGVTTVRDLGGGPLPSLAGGPGTLRYVAAGKFITVPGGYPIPVFGPEGALTVAGPAQAARAVRDLVRQGASVIKIAIEPGGEPGAPWSQAPANPPPPWPMLSVEEVRAIVEEAHGLGRIVTVHLGEARGARIALEAGVDEWAHIPGNLVPEDLLRQAVHQGVRVVATLDTESHCGGDLDNARTFVALGGTLLYGTDMGHVEIPDGFDANELHYMMLAGISLDDALAAATSLAGEQLGLAPLGQLVPGAPGDVIVAQGDPAHDLKSLEYPALVIAGGQVVVEDSLCVGPAGSSA
jgi:imidazolonepropionase-like amidohydrolase